MRTTRVLSFTIPLASSVLSSLHNAPSDAMTLPRYDLLINVHETTVLHDNPAVHKEVTNTLGGAVYERRGGIGVGTGHGQAVHREQCHIAALAGFECADIVSPQAPRPSAGGDPQRLACAHGAGVAASARDEHRLPHLALHLPAIVGGRTVYS